MSDTFGNGHCRSAYRADRQAGLVYPAVHGLTAAECGTAGALSHEEFYSRMGACPYCKALTNPKRRLRFMEHGLLQPFRGVTWPLGGAR